MNTPKGNRLRVPGASLHYEVRGEGPPLLLIAGGSADAGVYEPMATRLASDYTVVTYDPRGNSRSPLDGPWEDQRIDVHSDDAHRLLDLLATEPADVFGSSSGAIVGLDLIARYPQQVRVLVAHEPPAVEVLPDAAEQRAFFDEVHDTYRRAGVDAAMQRFAAGIGLGDQPPPREAQLPPSVVEMMSRISANNEFFLAHEVRQFTRFVPDMPALQAVAARIVMAGGRDSRAHLPYRPPAALAERIASRMVDFPGGHSGYMSKPAEFATQLTGVLASHHDGSPPHA